MRRFGLILENLDGFDQPACSAACRTRSACRPRLAVDPAGEREPDPGRRQHGGRGHGLVRRRGAGRRLVALVRDRRHHPALPEDAEPGRRAKTSACPPKASWMRSRRSSCRSGGRRSSTSRRWTSPITGSRPARTCSTGLAPTGPAPRATTTPARTTPTASTPTSAPTWRRLTNTPARRLDPMTPGDGGFDSDPEFEMPGMRCHLPRQRQHEHSGAGRGRGHAAVLPQQLGGDDRGCGAFLHHTGLLARQCVPAERRPGPSRSQRFCARSTRWKTSGTAIVLAKAAQRERAAPARETIEVLIADTEDAIEVLTRGPLGPLHPDAIAELEDALEAELRMRREAEQRARAQRSRSDKR